MAKKNKILEKDTLGTNGSKVFVTISNRQIYDELCQFKEQNAKEHQQIMDELSSYKSQVTNLKYAVGGIAVLAMTTLGFLVNHLGGV